MLTAARKHTRSATIAPLHCAVIICAYTEERWDDTLRAVSSVQTQQPARSEVIHVVDYNPELRTRLAEHLPDVRVVPNNYGRVLSGARNTGVALATGDIVAFLGDDAIPQITRRRRGDPR
jgi:hypothetical protein